MYTNSHSHRDTNCMDNEHFVSLWLCDLYAGRLSRPTTKCVDNEADTWWGERDAPPRLPCYPRITSRAPPHIACDNISQAIRGGARETLRLVSPGIHEM